MLLLMELLELTSTLILQLNIRIIASVVGFLNVGKIILSMF
jgi:hypothetical protein